MDQAKPSTPKRDKLFTRWGALKQERSSWFAHWQEISMYLLPRSGRFFVQDRDRGQKRHNVIYDSAGMRALKVLGSGMMAGATSPARPWFRLTTANPDLNKFQPVKVWLADVGDLMQAIFQKSNTYRALHSIYEEIGGFGTGASIMLPNFKNVIHHHTLTAGEYCIATDYQGNVCTLYREFERPVSEIVKEFGRDNCSTTIKHMYDTGNLDAWVPLIHAIEPRSDRDIRKKDNKNMPWGSYYFEVGGNPDTYLRESGFPYFPGLCPRWAVAGGDIYGNSPGMEALGDVKQLQHEQLRKAQGIDYKTNPPVQVPSALKNREVDTLPGGVTFYDPSGTHHGITSLFEVNLDLSHLLEDIRDVRERIRAAFYADLFLMLANSTDPRMTATEVAERHEEKLLMLGPVLERLQNELLNPLIENTFNQMLTAGILPTPPPEMHKVEINVEFVSMLAQAQRAMGANSVDRFVGNIGAIAQYKPDVLDKFDADTWADQYSDMLGVDPELIVPNDKVAIIRQDRAKQQAQQQQVEQAQSASQTAKNLSGATMGSDNMLGNVMNQFSGYNTPQEEDILAQFQKDPGNPLLYDVATGLLTGLKGVPPVSGAIPELSLTDPAFVSLTANSAAILALTASTSAAIAALTVSGNQVFTPTAITTSGALSTQSFTQLNNAGTLIAATLTPVAGKFYIFTQLDAGTMGHTLTLSSGTWDGTKTIATFSAQNATLIAFAVNATRMIVIANVGSVALS